MNLLGTLEIISISQIEFSPGNRGREYYDNMTELTDSMKERGLILPIAVYKQEGKEFPYLLIGGGRRLMAAKRLMWKEISCRIYNEPLSTYELKALELFENLHRVNLRFDEQAKMEAELNSLMVKSKGRKTSKHKNAPGHSIGDTAKLLGKNESLVRQNIQLVEMMKKLPELKLDQMKNRSTALNTLKRFTHVSKNRVLAETITKRENKNPTNSVREKLISSYILGDFFENSLPTGSFNLIECDPPYGIGIETIHLYNEVISGEYNEVKENYPDFLLKTCKECFRLGSADSWIILWCDWEKFQLSCDCLTEAGFYVRTIPGIWKKGNTPAENHSPSTSLSANYEVFIYGKKGDPKLRNAGRNCIFDFPGVLYSKRIHPIERPREMIRELLETFGWPGNRVLVPFAGSGNTLLASHECQMESVGFDLSREFQEGFIGRVVEMYPSSKA